MLSKAFHDFKPQPPFLDLGCGFGEFMSVFCKEISGNTIDMGIDINPDEIALASSKGVYTKLVCGDARDLNGLSNQFNTVTAISVLEHIRNVTRVFPEVYRALKPGGYFIFTVPTTELRSPLWSHVLHSIFLHYSLFSPQGWLDVSMFSGFDIKMTTGTLSPRQLQAFEYGLPFALITQLSRVILKRRLAISPDFRVKFLEKLITNYYANGDPSTMNILVVAQKPL